ncbi:MAG TPA: hypothetical protein VK473_03990 [Terriglobales bacterium]|nr:hypothetical protein [Terriglobales bacterium]
MRIFTLLLLLLVLLIGAVAQQVPGNSDLPPSGTNPLPVFSDGKVTLPAGTQIPLHLKQGISTKSVKVGDAVYAETTFPITGNDRVIIPAGTYVQGRITEVRRPGRVKGKAEVLMHFTSLVFPSGYTTMLPGAVENVPGSENQHMKGEEGTIEQNSSKGKDVAQVAQTAATGAVIGGLASGGTGKGVGIGGAAGAATGLAIALLTRGNDILLPEGTSVQMVLQRSLTLDEARLRR